MTEPKICFVSSATPEATKAKERLESLYDHVPLPEADIIVALGGDGLMLKTLHGNIDTRRPIYGMNRGTIGFLMNTYDDTGLVDRLKRAEEVTLFPLRMTAENARGRTAEALAVNDVSLLRQTRQAANIEVIVDGVTRIEKLVCDGAIVATPAGSTAYNLSAHGPILPITANMLALTPLSAFRPRRWRGAILPGTAKVEFVILENEKRPVSAVADYTEVRNVTRVEIVEDRAFGLPLLFDPEHNLEERILNEQFHTDF